MFFDFRANVLSMLEVMWSLSRTTQKIDLNPLCEHSVGLVFVWAYTHLQHGGCTVFICRVIRNGLLPIAYKGLYFGM